MNLEHSFNVELAMKFGINKALILENIVFWSKKNVANDHNFFDGDYWVFNSVTAWKKLFPYLSEKQIRSSLNTLVDDGWIKRGNYNKSNYDRTYWYAVKSSLLKDMFHLPLCKMDSDNRENESDQKDTPIPSSFTSSFTESFTTTTEKNEKVVVVLDLWNKLFSTKVKLDSSLERVIGKVLIEYGLQGSKKIVEKYHYYLVNPTCWVKQKKTLFDFMSNSEWVGKMFHATDDTFLNTVKGSTTPTTDTTTGGFA